MIRRFPIFRNLNLRPAPTMTRAQQIVLLQQDKKAPAEPNGILDSDGNRLFDSGGNALFVRY